MTFSRRCAAVAAMVAAGVGASRLSADELYLEGFDSESAARVFLNNASGGRATFVDYSSMDVGLLTHSIPEAPRRIAGSLATRGVLMRALAQTEDEVPVPIPAIQRIVNLIATDVPGGFPVEFFDNYRVKFDFYLRLSPNVTLDPVTGIPTQAGTTEQMLWGIGHLMGMPLGRSWRSSRGTGMWGYLATEGGFGASAVGGDAALFKTTTNVGALSMENEANRTSFFTPAFGADAVPVPHCPANQWVEANITVTSGQISVEYRGAGRTATRFFENVPATDAIIGGVMVGYEDSFESVSFDPDQQWMLLDNLVVEDATPATLTVNVGTPLTTYIGTPVPASFDITNLRSTGPLTISAVTFSGPDDAAFSVTTPLPLVVPVGLTAPLAIEFDPAAPNGVKSASMTIVSDDPEQPQYVISDLRARRSVPVFFAAHYKLDEASGPPADSSGQGADGAYQVREPLAYSQPSLLGLGSPGTSIGFLPAQSSVTGNYLTSPVLHTPTFTVSMWVNPASTGALRTLCQRDHNFSSPVDKFWGLFLDLSGELIYRVRSIDAMSTGPVVSDGEENHVALTHLDEDGFGNDTATRSRLFVNGVMVAEVTSSVPGFDDYPLSPAVSSLHVGTRTIAGWGYSGLIDDIQVYGAELTPEQVLALYQNPGSTAASTPESITVVSFTLSSNPARFTLEIASDPGASYQLVRSGDLVQWSPVGNPVPASAGATTSLEDNTPPEGTQYYRAVQQ